MNAVGDRVRVRLDGQCEHADYHSEDGSTGTITRYLTENGGHPYGVRPDGQPDMVNYYAAAELEPLP